METNKQKAYRCIDFAEKCMLEDVKKAEVFLLEAQKLFPTQKAKDLLDRLRKKDNGSRPPTSQGGDPDPREPLEESAANSGSEYTLEQLEAVSTVIKCNDFYKLLGVSKFASNSDIKKAYRTLALQFHPDKNKAPGAAEAFKKIGQAVSVLTDFENRIQYDFKSAATSKLPKEHLNSFMRDIWADIGGDDAAFKTFSRKTFTTTNNRKHNQEARPEKCSRQMNFLMSLLIALPVALYMLSFLMGSDPIYSFSASSEYKVSRQSLKLRVPYYVKEDFHKYQGSMWKLESSIEEEYLKQLGQACYREQNFKDYMKRKAEYSGCEEQYDRAVSAATPSCTLLEKLREPPAYYLSV